ncbi:MAG: ACT domain-containing protein [Terriglobales bacterium]
MPITREFTIQLEDRPGVLGKLTRGLADRGVNILAFQAFPNQGKSTVRFVGDNPTTVKSVLDGQRVTYTEAQVAQTRLTHRPGELARVSARLGENNVNIDYAYVGLEPGSNNPLLICGVADVTRAAKILDEAAAAAA